MTSRITPWVLGSAFALLSLFTFASTSTLKADEIPGKPLYNSQPASEPRWSPAKAAETAKVPDGFTVQVAAAEPDVRQPIAMAWDGRGRLWVVENYTYAEAAVKYDTELRDRVLILEDTNNDGTLDSKKVFWDQGQRVSSVEIGYGGVWVLAPPSLLFIPDQNQDDKPDSEPIVMLDGFDFQIAHHNMANGLRWGPDGWLYGRQGIQGISKVGVPGSSDLERTTTNCSVWRFHPLKKNFDIVCEGTTNPWGMDWDKNGHLFFINTVIGHLWHAIPGAHLQRMYGEDRDPNCYQLMPHIADHLHFDSGREDWTAIRKGPASTATDAMGGGHAHSGMMIYQGNQWPSQYRDKLFTLNFHGKRMNVERLEQQGAGYVGKHEPDMVYFQDPWFRGIDLSQAPDGSVIVLDWSDTGECHENDGVHRQSGTIYRVAYDSKGKSKQDSDTSTATFNLREATDEALLNHLFSENSWYARQARLILSERSVASKLAAGKLEHLEETFRTSDVASKRLAAFACLACCGKLSSELVQHAIQKDYDKHVQIAAVQAVADPSRTEDDRLGLLLALAMRNPDDLVATYIAGALQSIPYQAEMQSKHKELVAQLFKRTQLATDRDYPLMLWYAIMGNIDEGTYDIAGSYSSPKTKASDTKPAFAKINLFAMRSIASRMERSPEALNLLLKQSTSIPSMQQDLLAAMSQAFEGRSRLEPPANWKEFSEQAVKITDGESIQYLKRLQSIFGNGVPMEELAKIAADSKASAESRRIALQSMVAGDYKPAIGIARSMLGDRNLASDGVKTVVRLGDRKDIDNLVALYKKNGIHSAGKDAFIAALCGKREWVTVLLESVESGVIKKELVSADLRRQMQMLDDPATTQRIVALWPEAGLLGQDKLKQILALENQLHGDALRSADLSQGRAHWNRLCASCHKMFGEGGAIGPELTGAQRSNLRYLSENITDPSASVAANYRVTLLMLDDDQLVSGVVLNENETTLAMQTIKERIVIEKKQIAERKASNQSLMPEGLLDSLDANAKRDLFGYLQSNKQVAASNP